MPSSSPLILSTLLFLMGLLVFGAGVPGNANAQDSSWRSEAFGDGFDGFYSRRRGPAPAEPQYNHGSQAFPPLLDGGPRPVIEPLPPERIAFRHGEEPGTILIDTDSRRLYLTLAAGQAYVYPISVGREGFTWVGTERISRIAEWPDWYPPKEMRERDPRLPEKMFGGIRNPLGAVALFLGNSLYRIHGTNDPNTIGQAASSGCFRMLNGHAVHLASLVEIGTTVKVLPHLKDNPNSVSALPVRNPIRISALAG